MVGLCEVAPYGFVTCALSSNSEFGEECRWQFLLELLELEET
jgi:hypothetical protein